MADEKKRNVLRRVNPQRAKPIDDQLWPVNLAIVVLAGFVEGILIARFDFSEPNLLQNAWTWSGTLILSLAGAIYLATKIDDQRLRRSVQLAGVLSVLIHLVLAVMLSKLHYEQRALAELAEMESMQAEPEVATPDYYRPATESEDATADFEQPVAAETPDTPAEADAAAQRSTAQPTPGQSSREPSSAASVQANIPQLNRPDETVPRRAETPSERSRNTTARPEPLAPVAAPPRATSGRQAPAPIESQAVPSRREDTTAAAPPRPATEVPAAPDPVESPQVTRQESPDSAVARAATPAIRRRADTPVDVPRTIVPRLDVADAPRRPSPAEPSPSATSGRTATGGAPVARASDAQAPTGDRTVAQPTERPVTAQAPAAPARVERSERATASTAAPRPTAALPAGEPTPDRAAPVVQPSESALARGRAASASPRQADASAATGASASAQPDAATPQGGARREDASALAESTPRTARGTARRSPSNLIPSPVADAREAQASAGPRTARPEINPDGGATTRSREGLSGVGLTPNFDRGTQAPRSPARVALDSARRPATTTQEESGQGIAPSRPATVARRRADADVPGSSVRASDSTVSTTRGSAQPTDVDADASAALVRSDARAPAGRVTASAGAADIDRGALQVVSDAGAARPAGGGQPVIGDLATSPATTRRAAGGGGQAPQPALAALPAESSPGAAASGAPVPSAEGSVAPGARGARDTVLARADAVDGPRSADAGQPALPSGAPTAARDSAGTAPAVATSSAARGRRKSSAPDAALAAAEPAPMGEPSSTAGKPSAPNIDAPGDAATREASTAAGRATTGPGGALAGTAADAAEAAAPAESTGGRATEVGDAAGIARSPTGGLRRRTREPGILAGTADDAGSSPPGSTSDGPGTGEPSLGPDTGEASRRDGGTLVAIRDRVGVGGIGAEPARQAGVDHRRAKRESPDIAIQSTRVARRASRDVPAGVDTRARMPSEPFAGRRARRTKGAGVPGLGPPAAKTEETVELGLAFLAGHQSADGSWSLHNFPGHTSRDAGKKRSDTAATGLALLAFFGAAYDHYEDRYREVVRGGLDWLVSNQQQNGDLYVAQDPSDQVSHIYSHAIATIALCEAYGMTGDERLREPAQKAIDFLVRTQHPTLGGWRYHTVPTPQGTDTSVTGWALMALKSAELAKLKVPRETYDKVGKWLDSAQATQDGALYFYNPQKPNETDIEVRRRGGVNHTMTSVGLLMRLYLGWQRDHASMVKGANHLYANLPRLGTSAERVRDTYYWYYATQVMFHMGGQYWQEWNARLHPLLVDTQIAQGRLAGSWDPMGAVPDRWGEQGGRIYVTAMNLLSLEVYYRHLPIYEETAK